jgi:hypothetical protein
MVNNKGERYKFVSVLNQAPRYEDVWRSGGIAELFLTRTLDGVEWSAPRPLPFYLRGNSPRYPLDRRLGGPQSRFGRCGEEQNLLPLLGKQ